MSELRIGLVVEGKTDLILIFELVLLSWLNVEDTGEKGVLCIPSTSTDTWLAMTLMINDQSLCTKLFPEAEYECEQNVTSRLANLPKGKRVKKK